MSKIIKQINGVVVNRTLRCDNGTCPGIEHLPEGPAPLRMAQMQYSHIPAPECPFCFQPMSIDKIEGVNSGHESRMDKNRKMDAIQKDVFSRAERNGHKLAENSRQGDVGKVEISPEVQRMAEHANKVGMYSGFGNAPRVSPAAASNLTKQGAGMAQGYYADHLRAGAVLPMQAVASAAGPSRFWQNVRKGT